MPYHITANAFNPEKAACQDTQHEKAICLLQWKSGINERREGDHDIRQTKDNRRIPLQSIFFL